MNNNSEILEKILKLAPLAGVKPHNLSKIKKRGFLPSKHFVIFLKVAEQEGVDLSFDDLSKLLPKQNSNTEPAA